MWFVRKVQNTKCIYQKHENLHIWCLHCKWLLQHQVLENLDTVLFWYFEFSNLERKHLWTDVFCNVADRSQYYQATVQAAKEQSEHIQTFSQHYIETVPKALIAYFPSALLITSSRAYVKKYLWIIHHWICYFINTTAF